jgi:LacI family transcriptional regulator
MAADHFYERGFGHVGYVGHAPWSEAESLYEGYRDRAEELGIVCHLYQFQGKKYRHNAIRKERELVAWLNGVPKPLGLLVPGDGIAAGYLTWISNAGFSLPEDIAILSRDNNQDICDSTMPTISSIDTNPDEQIRAACELLDHLMAGRPSATPPIMIPPAGIVERESTNLLATSDPKVAQALRYMWDHLDIDLTVDQIAQVAELSSRQLARRFQQALGRKPTEELRRKRLQETKRLLRSTDMSIADLVPVVGFRSTVYLHRTFRAAFGMTPTQYRKRKER